jgi:hypothetical protein
MSCKAVVGKTINDKDTEVIMMLVPEGTEERLNRFFGRGDLPRGLTMGMLIEWAVGVAERQLQECEDDGAGECMIHFENFTIHSDRCDGAGMDALASID